MQVSAHFQEGLKECKSQANPGLSYMKRTEGMEPIRWHWCGFMFWDFVKYRNAS